MFETTSPDSKKTRMPIVESYSLNTGRALLPVPLTSATLLKEGTPVKLNTDGTVSPIAATTDIPFGVVVKGNKNVADPVTIQTQFSAMVYGSADGTVAVGNRVACSGYNGTTDKPSFKVGVSGDYIIGMALTGATTGNTIYVGIMRVLAKF